MPARHLGMSTGAKARESAALYRLLAWLSPSFPTGAFSYSHGLEAAAASGAVHDRATLQTWIAAIVGRGSGRMDADVLREAYRAAFAGDEAALEAANRRGLAYRGTAELALESSQQGDAFLAAWRAAWAAPENPSPPFRGERVPEGDSPKAGEVGIGRSGIPHLTPALSAPRGGEGVESDGMCLVAALGAAAAWAGIPLEDVLLGYLQAFAGNLVSAGLRLGIIGQSDGQRLLAALEPVVTASAEAAVARDPADFGSATFALDLASMAHEMQYSRLFRS